MAGKRLDKINAEMERAIQGIISTELKDPRIEGIVSVMRCEVTNDLKHAKVAVSVYCDSEEKKQATFAALVKCGGFIRHMLADRVELRCLPELHFELDASLDNSARINEIINALHKQDKR